MLARFRRSSLLRSATCCRRSDKASKSFATRSLFGCHPYQQRRRPNEKTVHYSSLIHRWRIFTVPSSRKRDSEGEPFRSDTVRRTPFISVVRNSSWTSAIEPTLKSSPKGMIRHIKCNSSFKSVKTYYKQRRHLQGSTIRFQRERSTVLLDG